ncbi:MULTISPECIES: FAD-binding oxidoreductase [Paenibacillus]|uniref:Glycolate oxidase subunit GlcD n=1 Tax=Paenibacillus aceti TaxID=1820010 RepID=A0ABQ1VTG6_9BACL|nr:MULTISPECIES: FAD-linked oxidase C-terminal domain-containing protein [Paenibacillus]NWL88499.1 FAD-binding protein [Paenibacillus sp. 79R4]GGF93120.1 glycolate oxidase subunit GlcD [Paenibacillus aceti]
MLDSEVRQSLLQWLGQERFREDQETLVTHSYDATPMLQSLPDAVVYPETTAEVQSILRLANEHHIPIVPRGAASNLCGGTVPVQGGIVVAISRMNKLLELDTDNLTATVQPGLNTRKFHQEVERRGLFYPPDPSSMVISTLGGNIMEGAGGLRGLKYGTTKDYVIGLEAVLPSGEIIRTGGKLYKDVAGYDLTKLLVGSEGTLALITEATLKLLPAPGVRQTMLVAFADIYGAARSVSRIVGARIIPATLEIMDQATICVVEDYNHIGLPTDVQAILLIEQDGQEPEQVKREMTDIKNICASEGATEIRMAQDEAEAEQLMMARRSALSTLARISPTTILEDATVPRSAIADMILAINRIAEKYRVNICTFGHAGDGNLHPTCTTDARNEEEIHRVEEAFAEIFEEAISMGGTITGEHGVGTVKAPYLEWKVGTAGISVMKGIKQVFDPNGIMNPGKIFAKPSRKRLVISK